MFKQHVKLRAGLALVTVMVGALTILSNVSGATGTTYYVATNGSDSNPGTEPQPWRTIQKAVAMLQPGDTVLVKNGLYDRVLHNGATIEITRSGRPDAWITIKAYPGHRPKVTSPVWAAVRIHQGASYIEVNGFEFEGIPSAESNFSGSGIGMSEGAHHIRILNNIVHNFGGGGIETEGVDYIHVEGNVVYNNTWGSDYGQSGISLYENLNYDNAPGYHNIIRGNIGYDNRNTKPLASAGVMSDGNCIIIDDGRQTFASTPLPRYTGSTLIENNVCFNNGGRGIHVFLSDNVDIFNNTLYHNLRSPEINDGELTTNRASNVRLFNNIVFTAPGEKGNYKSNSENITYGHNLYFNTTSISAPGSNDLVGLDPLFVNPSVNPASADFRLRASSPAIDRAGGGYFPAVDLALAARPSGANADLGAYEFITSILPTATSVPPTATPLPPTLTPVPPTATVTATPVPPTATLTATPVPLSATPIAPTATMTLVPPTNTLIPPTATQLPPSFTPIPATSTSVPQANTLPPPTLTPSATFTATVPPTATLPTDPSLRVEVSPAQAEFGATVSVMLQFYNVSNVYGLQAQCQVDPAVLFGAKRVEGQIFSSANSFIVDTAFQIDGSWSVAGSLLNPAPAFNGTGAAFALNYLVAGAGSTPITCTALAVDASGHEVPLTIIGSSFSSGGALVANASTSTVSEPPTASPLPPTPSPPPAVALSVGTVTGTAAYERRANQNGIHLRFMAGSSTLAELDTGADGQFTFTDVPAGNYVIEASAPGHLTLYYTVTTDGQQGAQTGLLLLLAGDADNSGLIDLADAELIGANFGFQSPPVPASADFYADGLINLVDLVLVGKNFGKRVMVPGA